MDIGSLIGPLVGLLCSSLCCLVMLVAIIGAIVFVLRRGKGGDDDVVEDLAGAASKAVDSIPS
ncbi:MAG: hypothetical protein AB8H79_18335, partial [Myxococcota bacterium]